MNFSFDWMAHCFFLASLTPSPKNCTMSKERSMPCHVNLGLYSCDVPPSLFIGSSQSSGKDHGALKKHISTLTLGIDSMRYKLPTRNFQVTGIYKFTTNEEFAASRECMPCGRATEFWTSACCLPNMAFVMGRKHGQSAGTFLEENLLCRNMVHSLLKQNFRGGVTCHSGNCHGEPSISEPVVNHEVLHLSGQIIATPHDLTPKGS